MPQAAIFAGLAIPVLAGAGVIAFGGPIDRIAEFLQKGSLDTSLQMRLRYSWAKAFALFEQSPVFGGSFGQITSDGVLVDGFYVCLLGAGGVVGSTLFFILLAAVVLDSLKLRGIRHETHRDWGLFISASAISLMINAAFTDIFFASKVAETFWFLVGIQYTLLSLVRDHKRNLSTAPLYTIPSSRGIALTCSVTRKL